MNLAALLLEHPSADPDPLLHGTGETLTAGEARAEAEAVAHSLRSAGVNPGAAVAVQLPNGPHAITAMFGVWLAGAVYVPLNSRAPAAEIERAIAATRPAAFVNEAQISALTDPAVYEPGVAFVTWTSGTTGAPKPVLHTHVDYLELLDRVLAPLRGAPGAEKPRTDRPPAVNLVPVSLALNAGIYNVLFGLRAGAAIVVMDGFTTSEFARLVARFSIRSTVLPPAAMTMLADDPAVVDLAPLRYVRSITAPLSPLQARRFAEKFGVVVLNGYGQAELGEVIGWTAADAREHPDKLGAVGRPHPGVALRIADGDGGVGRLLVRPPATAVGIDAARIDPDGYIDTGDFAAHRRGRLRVDRRSRVSDVINRGGNKVFPEHVEEVLRLVPGVVEAAVVGVPDERLGEVPVAFIVVRDPAVRDEDLVSRCRDELAPYKVPVEFHRVASLPRSDVGKILRRELRDRLER